MILGFLSERNGFIGSWHSAIAVGLASFVAVYLTNVSDGYFPIRGVRFAVAAFLSIALIQTLAERIHGETLPVALKHSLKSGLFIGAAGGLGMFLGSAVMGGGIS
ncbi:hypothetical protein [Bosea sp. MMO-172]|uniref:hypothetical protein n=1 Tax=Bosea sp. MMO-172 TaxID=3127885 RepID=UPI00301885A6